MDRHAPVAGLGFAGLVALAIGRHASGPPQCQHPDCTDTAESPGYVYCGPCNEEYPDG